MKHTLKPLLKELKEELRALYGERLVKVVLYGSQARGDADENSDIDVLVVLKEPFNRSAEITRTAALAAKLSLAFDTLIALVHVSEKDFHERQSPLMINVRREGVAL
jgi:uncharacterized protein